MHLADWPDAEEFPADDALVAAMDAVREITGAVLALRKQAGRRVRLPLANLTVVAADAAALAPFEGILRDELNVKSVDLVPLDESSAEAYGVTKRLSVNARAAGPRLGQDGAAGDPGRTVGRLDRRRRCRRRGRHPARAR